MTQSAERAALALSRFGLGARPGDIAEVARDPMGALLAEIDQEIVPKPTGALMGSTYETLEWYRSYRQDVERRDKDGPPQLSAETRAVTAAQQNLAETQARIEAILTPLIGFGERLAMFWANHFVVSVIKGTYIIVTIGAYEREVVRKHVFGRFADMLLAAEKHPAMLLYLDNHLSTGPNSKWGKSAGLNENLAREILELHTLGVDGGYTQADVGALARLITGWRTVGAPRPGAPVPGVFEFVPQAHEPGPQRLLGKVYEGEGVAKGEEALRDLARHPATAGFVAAKFARHFVADSPPIALVQRLAEVFRSSDGDLKATARALVLSPEAWSEATTKLRSPVEFLIAAQRALNHSPRASFAMQAAAAMGQPLWNPPSPKGWPDTADAWASPEGIRTRMNMAMLMARSFAPRVDPRRLAEDVLGPRLHPDTAQAVARAESKPQGLALFLMSPEFQRR